MLWFLIGIMDIKYIVQEILRFVKTLNKTKKPNRLISVGLFLWHIGYG